MTIDISAVASAIKEVGSPALLRRITTSGSTTIQVRAVTRGFKPMELQGGILQGDKSATISNEEILATGFPGPPQRGDQFIQDGRTSTVQGCETRDVSGQTAMHVMLVRGL